MHLYIFSSSHYNPETIQLHEHHHVLSWEPNLLQAFFIDRSWLQRIRFYKEVFRKGKLKPNPKGR
jgi:hypothetical protein